VSTGTLRPATDTSIGANWVNVGGAADYSAATRDNSDATYAKYPGALSTKTTILLKMETVTLAAGVEILSVTPRVRAQAPSGWGPEKTLRIRVRHQTGESQLWDCDMSGGSTITDYTGPTFPTQFDGSAWTQTALNQLSVVAQETVFSGNTSEVDIMAIYFDYQFNTPPTATITAPVANSTETANPQPTVAVTYADADGDPMAKYVLRVFPGDYTGSFDDPTSAAFDSGEVARTVANGASFNPTIDVPIPNGYWKIAIKVHDGTTYSAWASVFFQIAVQEPAPPTLELLPIPAEARVRVKVQGRDNQLPFYIEDPIGVTGVSQVAAAGSGTTIVGSTTAFLDGPTSLRVTRASTTGTVQVDFASALDHPSANRWVFRAEPGQEVAHYLWVARNGATARSGRLTLFWYKDDKGTLASATISTVGETILEGVTWTQLAVRGVCPADAVGYKLRFELFNVAASEFHYVDQIYAGPGRPVVEAIRFNGTSLDWISADRLTPAYGVEIGTVVDLRVDVQLEDWTPSTAAVFIDKEDAAVVETSYFFAILTNGKLFFEWFTGASGAGATAATSSVATGFTDGTRHHLRVLALMDDGAGNRVVRFETSSDGVNWTPLGTDQTGAAATIYDGTAPVQVNNQAGSAGTLPMNGLLYGAEIRYDGVLVGSVDPRLIDPDVPYWEDAQGVRWDLHGTTHRFYYEFFRAGLAGGPNLLPENASEFEDGNAAGVTPTANTTMAVVDTDSDSGTRSLELTSVAAGDIGVDLVDKIVATPGRRYTMFAAYKGVANGRTSDSGIEFLDVDGTVIHTARVLFVDGSSNGTWTVNTATGYAPPGTAKINVRHRIQGTAGAGEKHRIDSISLHEGSDSDTYVATDDYHHAVEISRSADDGQTWEVVTDLSEVEVDPLTQTVTAYDHTAPRATRLLYRARMLGHAKLVALASVYSDEAAAVLDADDHTWLKVPGHPELDLALCHEERNFQSSSAEDLGVFYANSRTAPIVHGGALHSEVFEQGVAFFFHNDSEYRLFEQIRALRTPVLLQTCYGETGAGCSTFGDCSMGDGTMGGDDAGQEQFWIRLGSNRRTTRVTYDDMHKQQFRRVVVDARQVATPSP